MSEEVDKKNADTVKAGGLETEKDFKPFVTDGEKHKELTPTAIILGIVLAVVFGAANAYLGLRVGLTVSASIPAAVISMGILRMVMKRNSILENNLVQTIGSAGESLAAGTIFTMPVFFLWSAEGVAEVPGLVEIALLALCGGILGVLFMIPLRSAIIVKEHGALPFPEGTACAEVLMAGERGGSSAKLVFTGLGFSAAVKFIVDGLKLVPGVITAHINALKTELSVEVYPALVGVGYICGPRISSYMVSGGLLGWLVLIPLIVMFGGESILFPGTQTINEIYESGRASAIWGNYIRYIGAGAVAAGGIISLVKSLPLLASTFMNVMKGLKDKGGSSAKRTEKDLDMRIVLSGIVVIIVLIWLLPQVPVSLPGAILVAVLGFLFGAVSSRMVGLVGASNNPISGMTIATLLAATAILKALGNTGIGGMMGAIAIGSIVCIIAGISGDTSQDLKTGFLVGATPLRQQIGEIVGVIVSALTIGGSLILLNSAWGFGSKELAAPQATLMKMIVEGVMDGNLPWGMIFVGAGISVILEILRLPALPIALGLYLPLEVNATIMVGGLVRLFVDKKRGGIGSDSDNGILFCSGMIAGEGLVGILLAVFAVINITDIIDLSGKLQFGIIGSIVILMLVALAVGKTALSSDPKSH